MEPLVVSNLVLWAVVILLAGVVLALLRQVGVLHERIAPAGALVGGEKPAVGEETPVLETTAWHGETLRIGGPDLEGAETLLFFVSPTCPVCKTLLPTVRSVRDAEGPKLRLVVASDGEREEHEPFVEAHDLESETYVLSAPLGMAYQVGRLPYAVLIGADGVVKARGLVNQREHLESLFEARDRGVASLQEYVSSNPGREVA
jgi:methylamine dehydrogenase accessory protein MauD